MIQVLKLKREGGGKQVECQSGSVIRRLDGKEQDKREGGDSERGMKRGSREPSVF